MGRSLPSFVNADCSLLTHDPDYAVIKTVAFDQPETIREGAKVWKARSLACWNHPEFKLSIHKGQGVKKTYHFLEYSGTRQLAEDIERVRQLFGDHKLNLYGLSYGTKVNNQLTFFTLEVICSSLVLSLLWLFSQGNGSVRYNFPFIC